MKAAYLAPFFALSLSACMGSFAIPEEKLPTASTKELCQSLAAARANGSPSDAARALSELDRRGTFSPTEYRNIAAQKAVPGMSETAGLCAWGYYWYGVNTTTTAKGTVKQYLIGDGNYNKRRYLYVTNGKVSATQE